jgi:predicted amidohydrolase YtcJ
VTGLLIRDAEVAGRRLDVRCEDGAITEVGAGVTRRTGDDVLDAGGGALLPGLHDHHLHLLAMAAARGSLDLTTAGVAGPDDLARAIERRTHDDEEGSWLRVVGFDERTAGPLDRRRLDALAPTRPVRVQHRSGHLWVLNSAACRRLGLDLPDGLLYDGDAELASRLGSAPEPDLATVGAVLARLGLTGVTDLTPFDDEGGWRAIAAAVERGDLRQRVVVTGGVALAGSPAPPPVALGPVKLVVSDAAPPSPDAVAADIATAHRNGRPVAIHCVTRVAAVVAIAAWDEAGAMPGDRMEHAAVLPPELAEEVARLGLTVVTQPGFVADRGDRYRREVEPDDLPHLYRCAGLLAAGIPLGGSSDAPYGPVDPWTCMAAAVDRVDPSGEVLGPEERLTPRRALELYLTDPAAPGGRPRRVEVGAPADLCLLLDPLDRALDGLAAARVAATVIDGSVVAG